MGILSRIVPFEIEGLDYNGLCERAKALHQVIWNLEANCYDYQQKFERQNYDMMELAERATQAWVALSFPGSHKTLRPPRPKFLCSRNTSAKRTEEPSPNVASFTKIPRMLKPKVSALRSQFLCPSTKRGSVKTAKQNNQ